MARKKVLITVKTYPTISTTHKELACTAGLLEDGSWIRLYPIPFRLLKDDQRYAKYQWIEADIKRNTSDPRPESFRVLNTDEIKVLSSVGTEREWQERRRLVLENGDVYTSVSELIALAHEDKVSLATFKPTKILDFVCEDTEPEWPADKLEAVLARMNQGVLFEEHKAEDFELVKKLPKKFSFVFEGEGGKRRKLMVEDWELGMLYWNCLKKYSEADAAQKVREMYFDNLAKTKDIYFFLGTTHQYHVRRMPNPYVIVGVFYPPHIQQLSFL